MFKTRHGGSPANGRDSPASAEKLLPEAGSHAVGDTSFWAANLENASRLPGEMLQMSGMGAAKTKRVRERFITDVRELPGLPEPALSWVGQEAVIARRKNCTSHLVAP